MFRQGGGFLQPTQLITCHEHGAQLAIQELKDLLEIPGSKDPVSIQEIGPGILKLQLPGALTEAAAAVFGLTGENPLWRRPLVWSRHRHPVHGVLRITDPESLVDQIKADLIGKFGDLRKQALEPLIQVRKIHGVTELSAGQIARDLLTSLGLSGTRDGVKPQQSVLSVTVVGESLYWGLGPLGGQWSPKSGGAYHYPKEKLRFSRASAKLYEAFEVFSITPDPSVKEGKGLALDLGAAPGGWTGVLVAYGYNVIAIDPGDLDAALRGHPKVKHLAIKAESARFGDQKFALITCDANWDPQAAQDTIVGLYDRLVLGGYVVFTLKLMHDYKKIRDRPASLKAVVNQVQRATRFFEKSYEIKGLTQLFHNRAEVTFLLQKTF